MYPYVFLWLLTWASSRINEFHTELSNLSVLGMQITITPNGIQKFISITFVISLELMKEKTETF